MRMYLEHYGLREAPFSITPDPRYVFLSERHRDALAHLLYGIGKGGSGGFVQLTGEVGTGKTTLSRLLLEQLPENTRVALVLNPMLSPVELVETVCEELKLDVEGKRGSLKALTDTLNAFLLDAYAEGLRVVLIVDEAQDLSPESLEQVRLLTNLETPTQKLLQIILLGQPELRELLSRPELRQLGQRVTARYHLMPLDAAETDAYVRHRMAVAGSTRLPFTRLGLRALYQRSGGVPRLINIIADRALMAGFAREESSIGERLVNRAADETLPGHVRYRLRRYGPWVLGALAAIAIALGGTWWLHGRVAPQEPVAIDDPAPAASSEAEAEKLVAQQIADAPDTQLDAFTRMLARWQVDPQSVSVSEAAKCPTHITAGVDCLRGRATLEQLARFDRPLILLLNDDEEGSAYAVLQGVGAHTVLLDIANQRGELPRSSLSKFWDGDFIAIWRLPESIRGTIKKGDAGAGVAWVMERLAKLDGVTAESGPAFFDTVLEDRVRRLQLAYGIQADGIVGPETLFALSAMDDAGPHLTRNVN